MNVRTLLYCIYINTQLLVDIYYNVGSEKNIVYR